MNKLLFFIILLFLIPLIKDLIKSKNILVEKMLIVDSASSSRSNNQLIIKEQKKLNLSLSKKQAFEKIVSYKISVQDLLDGSNDEVYFDLSKALISETFYCLKKDFCGMVKENDDDAYFDENKTPGHILLGRSLEIVYFFLRKNSNFSDSMDWNFIAALMDNSNDKIRSLAFSLYIDFSKDPNAELVVLSALDNFDGLAKVMALIHLGTGKSNDNRLLLTKLIEKSFALDDAHTVLSIIEKIDEIGLSKKELIHASSNLCRFKERRFDQHNWKMLKYLLKKKLIDINDLC